VEASEEEEEEVDTEDEANDHAAAAAAAMGHSPMPPGGVSSRATGVILSKGDNTAPPDGTSTGSDSSHNNDLDVEMTNDSDDTSALPPKQGEGEKAKGEIIIPTGPTGTFPKANGTSEVGTSRKKNRKAPKFYCPFDLNERDFDENTPLHVAVVSRKLECVRLLLEAGANVNKKCDGSAPVHTAISLGALPGLANFAAECLALLITYGADLSVKDEAMHTPLYLAAMCNTPRSASLILHDPIGAATLNVRAERSGGRPLHACAKFDNKSPTAKIVSGAQHMENSCTAMVTRMLLSTPGIEVDPTNTYGRTPLHIAALRGNWAVARLLLHHGANPNTRDQKGDTPGALAMKRGMVVPSDLLPQLGNGNSVFQQRDLIMDPNSTTLILCHELCSLHRSCPPISRGGMIEEADPPPENVRRLHVLINDETGILRSTEFSSCAWETEARRAAMADVLKVTQIACSNTFQQTVPFIGSQLL